MSIILCAEGGLPLGLNFLEVLLHLLNLAILIVAVRFLLYKPIKKFMDARKEAYKKEAEAGKKQMEEGQKLKEEGLQLIEKAQDDAVRLSEEATASALLQAEEIRLEAEKEAKLILENARKDAEAYQSEQVEELGCEVGEFAMLMASKILAREVTPADNDAIIDSVIAKQAEAIRSEAEKEAKLILENARKDADAYQKEQKEELGREVSELAMQMASKILGREVTPADTDAVIDSLIEQWRKKE